MASFVGADLDTRAVAIAQFVVNTRHERLQLDCSLPQQAADLCRRCRSRNRLLDIHRTLRRPGQHNPGTAVSTGLSLGCTSSRKRSLPAEILSSVMISSTGRGHHARPPARPDRRHVEFLAPRQIVFHATDQRADRRRPGSADTGAHPRMETQKAHAILADAWCSSLHALARMYGYPREVKDVELGVPSLQFEHGRCSVACSIRASSSR
jgi:hypothetical protein